MQSVLLTAFCMIAIGVMSVLLSRSWPHSSRRTGFRIWAAPFGPDRVIDLDPPVPEDDDVKWNWREGSPEPKAPGRP